MPVYEIDTDQGTFEIDADREPTQAEALAAISNREAPVEAPSSSVNLPDAAPAPSNLEQVISALTAGPRAGIGLAKGLGEAALKGVQGVGDIYGTAAGQQSLGDLLKSYYGNVAQTAQEIVPRASFDTANAIRMALQDPVAAGRGLTAISNPIAAAIEAFANPQAAPTQDQAIRNEIENQAFEEQGKQGVLEFAQQQAGLPSLGTANIDVARAAPLLIGAEAPLAAGVRALASPIQTAQAIGRGALRAVSPAAAARSLPATVEQSAMAALDISKGEVARHIPVVNQQVSKIFGKNIPKTAESALKNVNTAEASLYQDALVSDKAATAQGLAPRNDLIIQRVEETVNNIPTLLPEERLALIQDARARYNVSSTAEGRALQQRLNKEFEAQYANDTFDRAAPANEVKLAVRNSVAEQMDEINKAVTGIDANPYSDIGSLIEFKGNLRKKLEGIEGSEARRKTGLGASAPKGRLPTNKLEVAAQIKRSSLSKFQKNQLEILDDNVSKIFREGEKAIEPLALDADVQQTLLQKYGAQPTPPPLPVAPTPAAPSFSPSTLRALQEFGLTPDNPRWQAIGEQLEVATGSARPRVLLSETINR